MRRIDLRAVMTRRGRRWNLGVWSVSFPRRIDSAGSDGEMRTDGKRIRIRADLPPREQRMTLFHEVLHVIEGAWAQSPLRLCRDREEERVELIEAVYETAARQVTDLWP